MTLLKVLAICVGVLALVCLISIWHASTHFHKVYYRLSSDKISKPVKFVLLSDLHDQVYGRENSALLQAIHEEEPDAVLVAGDLVTATPVKNGRYKDVSLKLVKVLADKYPVYYGLGNHEAKMGWKPETFGDQYASFMKELQATGVQVLQNACAEPEGMQVSIYGLDLEQDYYRRGKVMPMSKDYLQNVFEAHTCEPGGEEAQEKVSNYFTDTDSCTLQTHMQTASQKFRILLAHNPSFLKQYAAWKPDLVLSGHVHGGLIKLPFLGGMISPSLELFPKLDGGMFQIGHGRDDEITKCKKTTASTADCTTMILSRGLGIHSIEFRMWNPGELVVITLVPEDK